MIEDEDDFLEDKVEGKDYNKYPVTVTAINSETGEDATEEVLKLMDVPLLEKLMKTQVEYENYEAAALMRNRIERLKRMQKPKHE